MTLEEEKDELERAFTEFCIKNHQQGVSLLAGLLIGLLEYIVEASDGDKNAPIKIEGGNRDIIVTAVYNASVQPPAATAELENNSRPIGGGSAGTYC